MRWAWSAVMLAGCLVNTSLYEDRLAALTVDDLDGDGFGADDDCDDTDDAIYPGAREICDEQDNDCNGEIDEGLSTTYWPDEDGDGRGMGEPVQACSRPDDHADNDDDCDDGEPTVYEGAEELCDGLDNDCNGTADDGPEQTFYRDVDGDGHGVPGDTTIGSCPPEGYVPLGDDCADDDPDRSPSTPEVCNGVDDDCDDLADDDDDDTDTADMVAWWPDVDGDGFGDMDDPRLSCVPSGVSNGDDCDDRQRLEGPPAQWREDGDGDGFGGPAVGPLCRPGPDWYAVMTPEDCDDTQPDIHPGARDWCDDGVDQNCVRGDAVCHPSLVDMGTLDGAEAAWAGHTEGMLAGVVVAAAGDQTGDGTPDLLIGASGFEPDNTGAAFVMSMPATHDTLSLNDDRHAILTSAVSDQKIGRGLAGGRDLDGDGQADLVIGAWTADALAPDAGLAYVVYGPVAGEVMLDDLPRLMGEAFDDRCCQVIELEDMGGDGQADIVLGSEYLEYDGNTQAGAVHVFHTPLEGRFDTDQLLSDASLTIYGASEGDQAGKSVGAADLDGDGENELIVGAFAKDVGPIDNGQVSVVYSDPLPTGAISADDGSLGRFLGEAAGDKAGEGLATGGDVTGDGRDDLLISARLADAPLEANAGKIYVIEGDTYSGATSLDTVPDFLFGEVAASRAGRSTAIVKSWDDDIYDWLVIGCDTSPIDGEDRGAVYIVPGPIIGAVDLNASERLIRGESAGDHAGYSIAVVGDVDRDGWEDVLVSAYKHTHLASQSGKVYLLYGTEL